MKQYWQRKPLLVRAAVPGLTPVLPRAELFALAGRDEVESRLVAQTAAGWTLRRGPLPRRSLPPLARSGWTLLVQGVDLHHDGIHQLLQQFRFVPWVRLDDLMISFASDGGGVGPHFDSYDVFLLQAEGHRRWRIGRQKDRSLVKGVPLKILASFVAEEEYLLGPGDMLYLPPGWAHDGVAQGACQTYSIGFRAPSRAEIVRELLGRIAEDAGERVGEELYRDRGQPATDAPGAIPASLRSFARDAVHEALRDEIILDRALGEMLTEPKASVWFDPGGDAVLSSGVVLDRRTRMLHDSDRIFVNGESWNASGSDAVLMRRLADRRWLKATEVLRASKAARSLLQTWSDAGWLHKMEAHDERIE